MPFLPFTLLSLFSLYSSTVNNSRRFQQFAVFILPQDRTPRFEERGLVFWSFLLSRGIDQPSEGFLFRRIVRIAPAVDVMSPPSAVNNAVPHPSVC